MKTAGKAAVKVAVKASANPAHQTTEPPNESRIGYLVYRLERRLRNRLDDAVRAQGVTTTEYVTLSVLRRHDGMSSAELARWAFVTPQAMNSVITALEKRRLVRRRPDPQHRRVLRTSLTRTGHDVLAGCERSMDLIERDMLAHITPEDVGALRSMLVRCAHSLEASRPMPPP